MADPALRNFPLAGFHGGSATVGLHAAPPAHRISLRAGSDAVSALSAAFGVDLPTKPKTSATAGSRTALWLGPDEWLVLDESDTGLANSLMLDAAKSASLHSATDVSHRNTAILVSGPGAANAINSGCFMDLSLKAFPVGACARTLLGKIEVVLLRTGEEAFRVEFWRSFSDYAFGLLREGAEDAVL